MNQSALSEEIDISQSLNSKRLFKSPIIVKNYNKVCEIEISYDNFLIL